MKIKNYISLIYEQDHKKRDDYYVDEDSMEEDEDDDQRYLPYYLVPTEPSDSHGEGGEYDSSADNDTGAGSVSLPPIDDEELYQRLRNAGIDTDNLSGAYGGDDDSLPVSPEEEEAVKQSKLEDITNAYLLKKIYTKLLVIGNIIKLYTNNEFDSIKEELDDAIEMMEILIDNYDTYRENIKDIIDDYQSFLKEIVDKLNILVRKVRKPQLTTSWS